MEEGLQKGMEEGLQKGQQELLQKLLAGGMTIEQISDLTGLSIADIENVLAHSS
jgi:predicted transposase/invertase (TIGR01784 family)